MHFYPRRLTTRTFYDKHLDCKLLASMCKLTGRIKDNYMLIHLLNAVCCRREKILIPYLSISNCFLIPHLSEIPEKGGITLSTSISFNPFWCLSMSSKHICARTPTSYFFIDRKKLHPVYLNVNAYAFFLKNTM